MNLGASSLHSRLPFIRPSNQPDPVPAADSRKEVLVRHHTKMKRSNDNLTHASPHFVDRIIASAETHE